MRIAPSRRLFFLGLCASCVGLGQTGPASAGAVGDLSLSIKKTNNQFHASLLMTINYAGLVRSNYPLFSLTVPSDGKFAGRRVNLPGGSVEGKIAKTNDGFRLRFDATTVGGGLLNRS